MQTEIPEYILDQLKKVQAFRSALTKESDRGCALLATSFLDNALSDLLYVSLVHDKKIEKELLKGTAPLATFSARINMSYYLGKICNSSKSDLHIMRRIRNQFGHNPEIISFETSSIRDSCMSLRHSYHEKKESPREHFIASALGVLGVINGSTLQAKAPEEMPDIAPSEERKANHRELIDNIRKGLSTKQDVPADARAT